MPSLSSLLLSCKKCRLTLDWQHEGIRLALVDMIRRAGDPTSRVEKVEHDEADGFKADVRSSQQRICLANRYKVSAAYLWASCCGAVDRILTVISAGRDARQQRRPPQAQALLHRQARRPLHMLWRWVVGSSVAML